MSSSKPFLGRLLQKYQFFEIMVHNPILFLKICTYIDLGSAIGTTVCFRELFKKRLSRKRQKEYLLTMSFFDLFSGSSN